MPSKSSRSVPFSQSSRSVAPNSTLSMLAAPSAAVDSPPSEPSPSQLLPDSELLDSALVGRSGALRERSATV